MAGKVTYMAPVENASGKILGKKQKWMAVTRSWGNRQKGCSMIGQRNLVTHPYSAEERQQHDAFKSASQLRSLIVKNAALRKTWETRFKKDVSTGATKCVTLGGYIQQQACRGMIQENGQPLDA